MKDIALFTAGAIMALLVPVEVSDNLRHAAISLFTFIGHARQAATAAPPESAEITLPAGEAAAAPQPAQAPAASAEAAAPEAAATKTAHRSESGNSADYISAEEIGEILRSFKGDAPGSK